MTQVHEASLALEFLYGVLTADTVLMSMTTGGIWRSLAPPSTETPFVIISFISGQDVLTAQGVRLMNNSLYQIKAVAPSTSIAAIVSIASEIDAVLKRTSGTVTSGLILSCYRESSLQIDELVNGVLWTNIGGTYRLLIQQTS